MSVLILTFGVIFLVCGYIYSGYKKGKKLDKLNARILEDFKLEKYSVLIIVTKNGVYKSSEIKPRLCNFFDKKYIQTSLDTANVYLNDCYNRGYFRDDNGITYPTCEIKKVWIEEVESV